MSSRRVLKAASSIREVVSMAILTELKDPRVKDVTVTGVEVAPDMRTAKVCVSIMGDETARRLSLRGLQNSAGFLQSLIAKRIDTRYTPRLTFVFDDGLQKSAAVARILQEWREESKPAGDFAEEQSAVDNSGEPPRLATPPDAAGEAPRAEDLAAEDLAAEDESVPRP